MASLSIILLADSTTPMVKPIDVFAEADDSVDVAPAQVYISDDNSDDNDGGGDSDEADSRKDNNMKRRKQAGLILNMLMIRTITRWWTTRTFLV